MLYSFFCVPLRLYAVGKPLHPLKPALQQRRFGHVENTRRHWHTERSLPPLYDKLNVTGRRPFILQVFYRLIIRPQEGNTILGLTDSEDEEILGLALRLLQLSSDNFDEQIAQPPPRDHPQPTLHRVRIRQPTMGGLI